MSKARAGTAKERSVFVGNIPYDVTEEMLKEVFSGAGTVVNFRLVTDRETGKPKGYGFCEYADGATALSAMRNLNGFEINGRNLRVDFADGGDKSNSSNSNSNNNSNSINSNGAVSGADIIQAIETAISRFGPLKLYDMLVDLKEHARQRPDHTKAMLAANPALTHAIVQSLKTLQIPVPSAAEMQQPALLAMPPPPMPPPPPMAHFARGAGIAPPPQRSPVNGGPAGGGGILGMAPPPPAASAPPPKAGGTRWSARPGPLAGMMPPPMASGPPPQQQQSAPPAYQGPPPPILSAPPPQQQQQQQQPPHQAAPPPMSRDPRRARDPRLAKRPLVSEQQPPPPHAADFKRARPEDQHLPYQQQQQQQPGAPQGNGTVDAIAELARDMTPQKLNMLPPSERQMLVTYMQQHGIPFST